MDPVFSQFGWTMFNAQVHLLVVLLIVRAVHQINIITVIMVRMSLWSVVSSIVIKCNHDYIRPQSSPILLPVVHMLHLIHVDMLTQVISYQTYIIDYMYFNSILIIVFSYL